MIKKKIFITGPSGMGKTTLAKYIEDRFHIPHISTSASKLWPKYGFKNHERAHQMSAIDPLKGLDYQFDILNERMKALVIEEEWVCDRSPIDNFVYFMLSVAPYIPFEDTWGFIQKIKQAMSMGNHLIIIPFTPDIRLDGPNRIKNPYYHQMTSKIMEWALYGKDPDIGVIENQIVLNQWDLDIRKQIIDRWLS